MEQENAIMKSSVLETKENSIKILAVSGDDVTIKYDTITGNNPSAYGNYIAIWQSDNQVPWGEPPIKTQSIENTSPSGTVIFDELDITNESYIIGYSNVPYNENVNNFCATGFIEPVVTNRNFDNQDNYANVKIKLDRVESNAVKFNYITLPGYSPGDNMNWMGIWEGSQDIFKAKPKYTKKVDKYTDQGTVSFNNVIMKRGTRYVAGYFMNGWDSSTAKLNQSGLACKVVFSVD